jgi:hypothetical protein
MRNKLLSTSLTLAGSVAVYATVATLHPTPAYAQSIEWSQDSTLPGLGGSPGCATQIAVGPNNVPWVLGCSGPGNGNSWLYQLVCSETVSGEFGETCKWQSQVNEAAQTVAGVSISVDEENLPWMTSANGDIWTSAFDLSLADGLFDVTAQGYWSGGRVSQCVAYTSSDLVNEMYVLGDDLPSHPNVSISESSPLKRIGASQSAAGVKLAMFTGTLFGGAYQTLTLITTQGTFWTYNPNSDQFVQQAGGYITDITDHYCLANDLFQWSDLGATWVDVDTPITPNGTHIEHIAYANTGPSELWGIDSVGHIFYNSGPAPTPPQ